MGDTDSLLAYAVVLATSMLVAVVCGNILLVKISSNFNKNFNSVTKIIGHGKLQMETANYAVTG